MLPLASVALAATLPACVGPLDTPPAYAAEHDICAPRNAALFDALVEECRALHEASPRDCGGVLGYRGVLQGTPIIVDSQIDSSEYFNVLRADDSRVREDVFLSGQSPYFEYRFELISLGTEMDAGATGSYDLAPNPPGGAEGRADTLVEVAMRIAAGGDSEKIRAFAGELEVDNVGPGEIRGRFVFEMQAEGDRLEGCFHSFRTSEQTSPEAT